MSKRNDYNEEYPLLNDEEWDFSSRPNFFQSGESNSLQNEVDSYLSRPGYFRSPLTLWDKISFFFRSTWKSESKNRSSVRLLLKEYGVPYRWEVLFRYLYRERIIQSALPERCSFPHDQPKMISFRFSLVGKSFGGRGNAFDVETALSKAVGESLERYFLSSGEGKIDFVGSVSDLRKKKKNFLHPNILTTFSSEQKQNTPYFNFYDRSVFRWVWCQQLVTGKKFLVPHQCVFFDGKLDDSAMLREQNSSGGAGGFSKKRAMLSALYELVERDGFLGHWFNGVAPLVIDTTDCYDQEFRKLMAQLERYQLKAVFLNTTSDIGVPSCTCVLMNSSKERSGGVAVGCAAGFDLEKLLVKSLDEAIMVFGSASMEKPYGELSSDYVPFSDRKIRLIERMLLWRNPEMHEKIVPFLSGNQQSFIEFRNSFSDIPSFSSFHEEYQYVLRLFQMRGKGYEIYFYQVKSKILDRVGYSVVKAIVPALTPLYLIESNASLGSPRLQKIFMNNKKMGINSINPWPHPLS